MKIVGVQSSPKRKDSNTLKLLNAALAGAREAGAEVELIDVARLKINYCKGCVVCYRDGYCHQKDDYAQVKQTLADADGVILTSPNYIDNVTSQLKTLFDRSANFIHEQVLDGKYGFAITTSGSGNDAPVLAILNHFLTASGARSTGGLGCAMAHGPAALEAAAQKSREMGADLVAAIRERRAYPEQEAAHRAWKERFGSTVKVNKDRWQHNYDYWVDKGWIKP